MAQPVPLRSFAIAATVTGAFLIESTAVRGPAAAAGLVLVAVGLAAFDAIDHGRVEARHAGLVAVVIGGGLGSWSLAIVALLALLELPVDAHLWTLLASGTLGMVAGLLVVRRGVHWTAPRSRRRR